MADTFIQWSETFTFEKEEAADLFLKLQRVCEKVHDQEFDEDTLAGEGYFDELEGEEREMVEAWQRVPRRMQNTILDAVDHFGTFCAEPEGNSKTEVWVHSDEGDSLDTLGACAEAALAVTEDDAILSLTWSSTCSSPREGAFGGGFLVIHANGQVFKDAWSMARWAEGLVEAHRKTGKLGEKLDALLDNMG